MKKSCIKGFISLLCNAAVIAFTAVCVAGFFTKGGEGNMAPGVGFGAFKYFTVDSNVLAALSALFALPWSFRTMLGGNRVMKRSVTLFKFVGAASVTLTMATVFILLGPRYGYGAMFEGNNLYMHLITPLLMIVSFAFAESKGDMPFKGTFLGLVPTAVYGMVYIVEVLIIKEWNDFYFFNAGGKWYIYMPAMVAASYLICVILWLLRRVCGGFSKR